MNFEHTDCDKCGTLTETHLISDFVPWGRQRYYLENITVEECPQCGNRYFSGLTMEEIKRQIGVGAMRPAA